MKKFLLLFLTALPASNAICQSSKIPLDKSFIEKTIEYYYSTQARKNKGASLFFIEKDSMTMPAKTDYSIFKVQFLSPEEASARIPAVQKDVAKLDRMMIKWISLDTIDVVITGCTIGQRKTSQVVKSKTITKTENFHTNCTDQFVDVPTCRFVYDPATTKWTQLNRGKEISEKSKTKN